VGGGYKNAADRTANPFDLASFAPVNFRMPFRASKMVSCSCALRVFKRCSRSVKLNCRIGALLDSTPNQNIVRFEHLRDSYQALQALRPLDDLLRSKTGSPDSLSGSDIRNLSQQAGHELTSFIGPEHVLPNCK
jgi:hypothetical protein